MGNAEEHKEHHKSDFHRFNLKRKMINLAPVTVEQFNAKVADIKREENAKGSFTVIECKLCKKKFGSEGAYNTHVTSNKHKEKENTLRKSAEENGVGPANHKVVREIPVPTPGTPTEPVEEDKRTMEEVIDEKIKKARKILPEECLFCLAKSADLESNVEHMEYEHGFFIPDREHLKDLGGLIEYLGEKISVGTVCLWCNEDTPYFDSLNAVQQHMRTLAHCKLAYDPEDEAEYSEFYNFGPESENALIASNLSDATSEYQIVFNDGKVIGHRSLQRYYRQRFRPSESREMVLANTGINDFKIAGWYRDAIQQDKLRQSFESSRHNVRTDMAMGVRANFLWRFRKENVTTRNSGR